VRIFEGEIQRMAASVVSALLKQGFVHPTVGEKELRDRIAAILLENLKVEEALEREAEELADKHSRQSVGMDHRKIVAGIKARLAKERGFVL
jgi:hypothetical protein